MVGALWLQSVRVEERQAVETEDRWRATSAEAARSALMSALGEHHGKEYRSIVQNLAREGILTSALYRRTGELLVAGAQGRTLPLPQKIQALDDPAGTFKRADGEILVLRRPLENLPHCRRCHGNAPKALGFLELGFPKSLGPEESEHINQELLALMVVVAALIFSISIAFELFVSRPARTLRRSMQNSQSGQPVEPWPFPGTDELGSLAEELYALLESIRQQSSSLETYQFELIRQSQKMTTIGELASALGHEIKNPMAGISGALQVFIEEFQPEDPRREVVNEVQEEIERLDRAFKDLLSFARSGEPGPVLANVGELLAPAVRLIANQAKKQNVHVNIKDIGITAEIYADPEQLQQVFLSFMLSALHSMPDGGTLDIGVQADEQTGKVEVSFNDTGEGISPEDIAAAFEEEITPGRPTRGSALGISRRLAEINNGSVKVSNRDSGGATYAVTLPIRGKDVQN